MVIVTTTNVSVLLAATRTDDRMDRAELAAQVAVDILDWGFWESSLGNIQK